MFTPSREDVRRFFAQAYRKWRDQLPLEPIEAMAADVIALHPEYFPLLEDEAALARDYTPEDGGLNPFLHLSLHLAIEEQLSINQPPGIREAFEHAQARHGDRHAALHDVLECLGETIWRAQRDKAPLDGKAYVECVWKRAGS